MYDRRRALCLILLACGLVAQASAASLAAERAKRDATSTYEDEPNYDPPAYEHEEDYEGGDDASAAASSGDGAGTSVSLEAASAKTARVDDIRPGEETVHEDASKEVKEKHPIGLDSNRVYACKDRFLRKVMELSHEECNGIDVDERASDHVEAADHGEAVEEEEQEEEEEEAAEYP